MSMPSSEVYADVEPEDDEELELAGWGEDCSTSSTPTTAAERAVGVVSAVVAM